MSGFFLNQKSSFFAFLSQQNQDLFLIQVGEGRSKPGQCCTCQWTPRVSPSRISAYLVTLACAFHTFSVQIIPWGSCLVCSDWPERLVLGEPFTHSWISPFAVPDHSPDGLLGQTEAACGGHLPVVGSAGPGWRRPPCSCPTLTASDQQRPFHWVG